MIHIHKLSSSTIFTYTTLFRSREVQEEAIEQSLRSRLAIGAAAAMVLLPRVALAVRRAPEYDELFTVWIARKPFGPMMETLQLDSGPPLYYLIIRALHLVEVPLARGFSIAVAVLAAIVCCRAVEKASDRLIVGALLAVYPLHLYFATEARAYAFCALAVGIAAVAMDRWVDSASRNALAIAAAALIAGAYAHHYVVFLFPLPLVFALLFRRDRLRDAVFASVAIAIAFEIGRASCREAGREMAAVEG